MPRYYEDKDGSSGAKETILKPKQFSKKSSKIMIDSDAPMKGVGPPEESNVVLKQASTKTPLKNPLQETVKFPKEKVKKFNRAKGEINEWRAARSKKARHLIKRDKSLVSKTTKFAARTEILQQESEGYIEADPYQNEQTYQVTQKEIVDSVDITTATKHFDLNLQHGPYNVDYFRSGRHLLLGGKRGHVAAIDWITKDLMCEFNVQESIHAVKWLHVPNMFAVAQKDWVHVYDSRGTELHCLKKLYRVQNMEFLPYHFLLVTQSDNGFLSWTDTSIGRIISTTRSKKCPRFTGMCQNASNAIIHTSHPNGVVNLWSPNSPDPLISMLCHGCPIRGMDVDSQGKIMTTVSANGELKLWDIRKTYNPLFHYNLRNSPSGLACSQRGLVAVSTGDIVQVFKDLSAPDNDATRRPTPYLRHKVSGMISSLQFVNFEDVLGVAHSAGFTSCIVPGASEANFDAFEANPYMSKSQRREMEVKSLLEKVQPELISLNPHSLASVNVSAIKQSVAQKRDILYVKNPDIELKHENDPMKRKWKKIKSTGVKGAKAKSAVRDEFRRKEVRSSAQKAQKESKSSKIQIDQQDEATLAAKDALDRFKKRAIEKRMTHKNKPFRKP